MAKPDSARVLGAYEVALACTREMLALAKANEWDALMEKEMVRYAAVDSVKSIDIIDPADRDAVARKEAIIREILLLDEETRRLTLAWMDELRDIFDAMNAQRDSDEPAVKVSTHHP